MGKLTYLQISLQNNPNAIYRSGGIINGQVEFAYSETENLRGIRVELTGKTHTHWTESEGSGKTRHTVSYGYTQYHLETTLLLWGSHSSESRSAVQPAPKGNVVMPFSFQLPNDLPESFEGESYGYTRYSIKAVLDRPWKFDRKVTRAFTLLANLDLNEAIRYGFSESLISGRQMSDSVRMNCCCCCPLLCNGRFHYDFTIGKTGYVPGESVRLWGFIRNETDGELSNLKLQLYQRTTFYGARYTKTIHAGETMHRSTHRRYTTLNAVETPLSVQMPIVRPKETFVIGEGVNNTSCSMLIPALPCSRNDESPINIKYYLQVSIDGSNCCLSAEPDLGNIILGTAPLTSVPLYPPLLPLDLQASAPPQYELPPPSYMQSIVGPTSVNVNENDATDGQSTKAKRQQSNDYAPIYTFYDWSAHPPQ